LTVIHFQFPDYSKGLEKIMKNSIPGEFPHSTISTLLFKSLSQSELEPLLLPFYLSLDFDARRLRFGGGVSDASIRAYCAGLDLANAVVLACLGADGVVTAIELHPLASAWEHSELALADRATADRTTIVAHLLQLAAFAAGTRGCTSLVAQSFPGELLELLRGMGRVRREDDAVRIEIGEYAMLLQCGRT
jgi:hypothetical protein